MHHSNIKKKFLTIDNQDKKIKFCYLEKGQSIKGQSSIVFIHGFSSNKYTWLQVIKQLPDNIHAIAIDMPFHGETKGFQKDQLTSNDIAQTLNQLLRDIHFDEPVCLVGTSMGASIVSIFATKYPSFVSMICLLAPVPPGKQFETEMLKQLQNGEFHKILPENRQQFLEASDSLSMRKYHFRRLLAREYLKMQSALMNQHRIVLKSAFENDYPQLNQSYEKLKTISTPALIIWGKQDQLCTSEGAHYFSDLIENSQVILFDDCGHLIANDKPKETAQSILKFWNNHHSFHIKI